MNLPRHSVPLIYVCFSRIFPTTDAAQQLYQMLQYSPSRLAPYLSGGGSGESWALHHNTAIVAIRYLDQRFPQVRLLRIPLATGELLVKVCEAYDAAKAVVDLLDEK